MLDLMSLHPLIIILVVIFPAYSANFSPAFFSGILRWKWHPLDRGKKLGDGERVLGDGKTFEGILVGVLLGVLTGLGIQQFISGYPLFLAFLAATGALAGDAVESFVKRRRGFKRGEMWFPADQLDFVIGALLFLSPFYLPGLAEILFITFLTIAAHLSLNLIGWLLGLKSVPW